MDENERPVKMFVKVSAPKLLMLALGSNAYHLLQA